MVGRRTLQNGEGTELPAIAVRGHQVPVWRGFGEVGVTIGEDATYQRVMLAPSDGYWR